MKENKTRTIIARNFIVYIILRLKVRKNKNYYNNLFLVYSNIAPLSAEETSFAYRAR